MKNLNIVTILILAMIACICSSCIIFPIIGNGNLVTFEKNVSAFEKINSSGSADVRFHESPEYKAVVTVDSNLVEYVEIKSRNNRLSIGTKNGHLYSFTEFIVDVYCPTLTGVSLSGSGTFESPDTISVSSFDSNVSGSGKIYGTIECDNFHADISGSGKINIDGSCLDSSISISGSGRFNGNEFYMNNAAVHISGSGKATISVSDNLKATVSGSGEINYNGNPKISSNISGSGRIKKL